MDKYIHPTVRITIQFIEKETNKVHQTKTIEREFAHFENCKMYFDSVWRIISTIFNLV